PAIVARTAPPAASSNRFVFGLARPFGVSSRDSSSVTLGTLTAFSNPTSISMLIVPPASLRVNPFHLPDRPCKLRSRLVEALQRRSLVIVRARQRVLRLDDFDVVGPV